MDFLLWFLKRHFAGKPLVAKVEVEELYYTFAERGLIKSYVYVIELVQVCKMY